MSRTGEVPAWHAANRAYWDEAVPVHVRSAFYDVAALRAGTGRLYPIEEAELGPVAGLKVLHLQCHFGYDTLFLAQRGADVTGLDFSAPAIATAHGLAEELGLARARFVHANLYDAVDAVGAPAGFDLVFVSWGALMWLHDIRGWAATVAYFLKPGGRLYLAEGHPFALIMHASAADPAALPCVEAPYFSAAPIRDDSGRDYADESVVATSPTYTFLHPLGGIVTALTEAGLALDWLHEHDAVPWRMFDGLRGDPDRMFRWPDQPWLPLSFSLSARRRP